MSTTLPTAVHAVTGLRDVVIAKLLTDTADSTTYETPQALSGAISAEYKPDSGELKELWYDDHAGDVIPGVPKGKFTMKMQDMTPEARAYINNHKTDQNGVVVAGKDDKVEYFAIGFKSQKSDGYDRYEWIYKAYAAVIGSKSESANKDGKTPQEADVEFTYVARESDGAYHAFVDENATAFATAKATFFTAVYEPSFAS